MEKHKKTLESQKNTGEREKSSDRLYNRIEHNAKRTKVKECKEEGGRGKGAGFEINR